MKCTFILLFLSLMFCRSYGQTQDQQDSLVHEMCNWLLVQTDKPDSAKIKMLHKNFLRSFLEKFPENNWSHTESGVFFRLQRNCKAFVHLINRQHPIQGDWELLETEPRSTTKRRVCKKFWKQKEFTYYEWDGALTRLVLEGGYWVDYFLDETYSKLKLLGTGGCEFQIAYLESNNGVRSKLSLPGDVYRYKILSMGKDFFDLSMEIPETKYYARFKLYFEK